jgi:hypothetical protein
LADGQKSKKEIIKKTILRRNLECSGKKLLVIEVIQMFRYENRVYIFIELHVVKRLIHEFDKKKIIFYVKN